MDGGWTNNVQECYIVMLLILKSETNDVKLIIVFFYGMFLLETFLQTGGQKSFVFLDWRCFGGPGYMYLQNPLMINL